MIKRRAAIQIGLACILFAWLSPDVCRAGLKVYYIRHAEGGHNVVKDWEGKPKDQWPSYVGNPNVFTPKGLEQVKLVAPKLSQYHFDFIAASPLWRTRNTVLPYLKQTNRKAEIWPELEEFEPFDLAQPPLPRASADLWTGGAEIVIPQDERRWFTLPEGGARHFKLGASKPQMTADTKAITARIIDIIRTRFGGKDQSILLVGHGTSGRFLLTALVEDDTLFQKNSPDYRIANTGIWMAEQQPDGKFKLMILNDKPYKKVSSSPTSSAK